MSTKMIGERRHGFSVFHKGLVIVLVPLLIEIALIALLGNVLQQLDRESVNESRNRRCAAIGAKLIVLCDEAAIHIMAWFQSGDNDFLRRYDNEIDLLKKQEAKLIDIAKTDPLSREAANDQISALNYMMALLDRVAVLAKKRDLVSMAVVIPEMDKEFKVSKSTHIASIGNVISVQEKYAQASALKQVQLRSRERNILLCGLIANAVIAVMLFRFFRNRISDRLKVVQENTRLISEGRELKPTVGGTDEIRLLDDAFHQMANELKQASERERSLFENASDVICVLDEDFRFVRINPACKKLWGREPDELVHTSLTSIVESGSQVNAKDILLEAQRGGHSSRFELIIHVAEGKTLETLFTSYWSNEEKLMYCVAHDISERKRTERIKQSYLSMISSNLRKPLGRIAENADRLSGDLKGCLSEKALQRVEIVKNNLGRLLVLVNDLLEMSALDSGSLSLSKAESPVLELLQRSANDLDGLAQQRKIKFQIDCAASTCFLDPNKIMQVIVNLASNALKFSPEGGVVELSALLKNESLRVSIKDHGRGVPASHRQTIFEKFKQVEASDGKRSAGTGLGLPICKEIVEKHGGKIGVDSEEGKGSVFWFEIPLNENDQIAAKKDLPLTISDLTVSQNLSQLLKPPETNSIQEKKRAGLSNKGLLLIGVPLLFEFLFVLSVLSVIVQTENSRVEELRQRQIASESYVVLDKFFKMVLLISASSSRASWLAYDECCARLQEARSTIKRLVKNDPVGARIFQASEKFSSKLDPIIEHGRDEMGQKGYTHQRFDHIHVDRIELFAITSGAARRLYMLMDLAEGREAVNPAKQAALRKEQSVILLGGLALNVLLSLFMAKFFSQNITTRLATLADNTVRFARGLRLNPLVPGNDEISQIDRSFHQAAYKIAEARKKERAVFDNSQDLIATLDSTLCFSSINPAAERLLGRSQDELQNKSILELLDVDDRTLLHDLLQSSDLAALKSLELKVVHPDGNMKHILCSLSRTSKESEIYCVAHDITDRKQLEQLKQEFIAVVSHDLRNPLGSVVGFITLIKAGAMGVPEDEAVPVLDEIILQADVLLEMINDLLDIEKLEAKGMQLQLESTAVEKLIFAATELVLKKYPGVLFNYDINTDIELNCDLERLEQAIKNICFHILKRLAQSPGAHPKIDIAVESAANQLDVFFSAEKLAYTEEELLTLFERFKSSETDDESVDSSLNLPLAKSIIEAHSGTLSFSSTNGNKFIVRLPLRKTSEVASEKVIH